jgi:hypothetical protein
VCPQHSQPCSWGKFPREGKLRAVRGVESPTPRLGRLAYFLGAIVLTLAYICIVIGVILIILSAVGVTGGITPYGTHGGVVLLVVGIILYVVLLLLPHATV